MRKFPQFLKIGWSLTLFSPSLSLSLCVFWPTNKKHCIYLATSYDLVFSAVLSVGLSFCFNRYVISFGNLVKIIKIMDKIE